MAYDLLGANSDDETKEQANRLAMHTASLPAKILDADERPVTYTEPATQARFKVDVLSFIATTRRGLFGPVHFGQFYLDEAGRLLLTTEGVPYTFVLPLIDREWAGGSAMGWILRQTLLPAWFAFSLLHCKNVSLSEQGGVWPSRQARRQAERKGQTPPTKFYTIQIDPMKRVLNDEGGMATGNGLKKALHICRGHFSTYSDDKPLFGKYAGTFWIPSHVRGSAEAGQIVKDYRIKAPKESAA